MTLPILVGEKLCQVAIVVRDIEQAAREYAALLGEPVAQPVETEGPDTTGIRYKGQPTAARAKLAFYRKGPVAIELIQPLGSPSVWLDLLEENGPSVHHLAFRTDDMQGALARLNQAGFPTVQTGNFTGGSYAYIDTRPALGVMVELLASSTFA